MSRGKKTCPSCDASLGVRTRVCECGHEFKQKIATSAVAAPKQINKSKKPSRMDEIRNKFTPAKINKTPSKTVTDTDPSEQDYVEQHVPVGYTRGMRIIQTPAGNPPCVPAGYKGHSPYYRTDNPWPKGQPTDEAIQDWALLVRDKGLANNCCYTVDAVIYFARHFWSINDYDRFAEIKGAIQTALTDE